MHPLKIVILLVLAYLLYRLYRADRRKKVAARREQQRQQALEDVLVQDPVCGAYVASGRSLVLRRGGEEHHFCSEECRRKFAERQ
ncbi:MAG: YHS domain-containing protein [Desulfurivibrio sp.]|nr:YHS domain-containing protein [Desulfurivibrio sp.]